MKLRKKIIKILTITSMISLFPISSYADYGDITIDPSFTYEDGLWKPGRVDSKNFYINNNKENDISIDRLYMNLKSCEYWKTGEKLDINSNKFKEFAKHSTVTLKHNDTILFKDTFENLLSEKGIKLSEDIYIKSNSKEQLNMTIDMDLEMNNDAQALNNVFTMGVAYKMEDNFANGDSSDSLPGIKPENPIVPDNNVNGGTSITPDMDIDGDNLDGSNRLPQTGGVINSTSLIALGAFAIGTGAILNKKSDKKGGGKHNE